MNARTSSPALPVLAWALLLAALTAVALIAFDVDVSTPALLGGAAVAVFALGVAISVLRPGPEPERIAEPESSVATAWVALAITLLALSAIAGLWLTLIAAGMLGAGLGRVGRELAAERADLRARESDERA